MADYIDREELLKEFELYGNQSPVALSFIDETKDAPSVDAVEVVRCKDCKHTYKCACDGTAKNICDCMEIPVYDDFFCKWGEKNENIY